MRIREWRGGLAESLQTTQEIEPTIEAFVVDGVVRLLIICF